MTQENTTTQHATTWPLRCPECGDRLTLWLPAGTPEGRTGTETCRRGHEIVYGYDGVTVRRLEFAADGR